MSRIILGVLFVCVMCLLTGCGAVSRAQYEMDCDQALDIHPADAQELEPRHIHHDPDETSTANIMVSGTTETNRAFYSEACAMDGWYPQPLNAGPDAGTQPGEVTLKFKRGFEYLSINIRQVASNQVQIQQRFTVTQPTDQTSRKMQAQWDSTFHFLAKNNPVRSVKFIF